MFVKGAPGVPRSLNIAEPVYAGTFIVPWRLEAFPYLVLVLPSKRKSKDILLTVRRTLPFCERRDIGETSSVGVHREREEVE